jgi:5'-nucleotidase
MSTITSKFPITKDREYFIKALKEGDFGDKPIILVDLDGVVFDWSKFVRDELHKMIPSDQHKTHEQVHSFYLEDVYPGDYASKIIRDITSTSGLYIGLEPIEGSVEAVKKLAGLGYPVFFCTAPETRYEDQMCYSEKAQSIEKHFGPAWVEKLILTKDKTLVQGAVLVDDKPPRQIKGLLDPTWVQMLFDQPYNQNPAMCYETTWRGRWDNLFEALGETL